MKMDQEKITQIDIDEWPIAILVVSDDEPDVVIHVVLYPTPPSDSCLMSLKMELINDMGYDGPPDKLQYIEISTEEYMDLIGATEVKEE